VQISSVFVTGDRLRLADLMKILHQPFLWQTRPTVHQTAVNLNRSLRCHVRLQNTDQFHISNEFEYTAKGWFQGMIHLMQPNVKISPSFRLQKCKKKIPVGPHPQL
jgi:hypothetical protein